jgi:hypothetical protein
MIDSDTAEALDKRVQTPARYRKAKADAKLATIQETVEKLMGLPSGCVRFVTPAGKKVRSDATVRTLRAHWED